MSAYYIAPSASGEYRVALYHAHWFAHLFRLELKRSALQNQFKSWLWCWLKNCWFKNSLNICSSFFCIALNLENETLPTSPCIAYRPAHGLSVTYCDVLDPVLYGRASPYSWSLFWELVRPSYFLTNNLFLVYHKICCNFFLLSCTVDLVDHIAVSASHFLRVKSFCFLSTFIFLFSVIQGIY
jgi:hypothetical protein